MVKGVTRRIVEIKETGSNYFERAIFFVSMDHIKNASESTLSQEARRIIDNYSNGLPPISVDKKKNKHSAALSVFMLLISAAAGAIATIIVMKIK
jgi:hypothetical protein